jgi:hypothetical protein
MGTTVRTFTLEGVANESELHQKYRALTQEDVHEHGHGHYQGSLSSIHGLTVSQKSFPTFDLARKVANNDFAPILSKGDAIAFKFGDSTKAFPNTAKDKALFELNKKLKHESITFENEILKRFVASKSSSKKCTHCDSVISKKSRERLAKENFLQTLDRMDSYLDREDYKRMQSNCPACGGNLLVTDTDKKRKQSIEERLKESSVKLEKAKSDHELKIKQSYGYIILAACAE